MTVAARLYAMEADGHTTPLVASVPARAAIAGNPSDGYGGAVVAIPLPRWTATATARPSDTLAVVGSEPGDDIWELAAAAGRALVRAAGAPDHVASVRLVITTTIPRSVGLAGSSAIILAVCRTMMLLHRDQPWAQRLADPRALAVVAHQAEIAELGIGAGMQDRLVQSHGVPLLMDFSPHMSTSVLGHPCGSVRPLPLPDGRWIVALRPSTAESSGVVHGELTRRAPSNNALMSALADTARTAARALECGDLDAVGASMDRSFELRAELLELDPRHVAMVEAVRHAGGYANYTGSGGAVVAYCPDASVEQAAASLLAALAGCHVHPITFGGGPTTERPPSD